MCVIPDLEEIGDDDLRRNEFLNPCVFLWGRWCHVCWQDIRVQRICAAADNAKPWFLMPLSDKCISLDWSWWGEEVRGLWRVTLNLFGETRSRGCITKRKGLCTATRGAILFPVRRYFFTPSHSSPRRRRRTEAANNFCIKNTTCTSFCIHLDPITEA